MFFAFTLKLTSTNLRPLTRRFQVLLVGSSSPSHAVLNLNEKKTSEKKRSACFFHFSPESAARTLDAEQVEKRLREEVEELLKEASELVNGLYALGRSDWVRKMRLMSMLRVRAQVEARSGVVRRACNLHS